MTIFDITLQFSDQQAVTATAVSTHVVDLGATGTVKGDAAALVRDIAPGSKAPLLIQVTEAFNNLTSLALNVQSSTDEAFTAPQTQQIDSKVLASLVAGARTAYHSLPEGMVGRYLRLQYVVTGTDPTAGKITAGFVASVDEGK